MEQDERIKNFIIN